MTTLCPGPVETGFAEAAGMTDEEAAESLPKIMWIPADDVARAAVEGLAAGRTVVIPGTANRVGAGLAHLAPKSILVPLLAKRHPARARPPDVTRPDGAGRRCGGQKRRVTAANVSDAARPRTPARERRDSPALAVAQAHTPDDRRRSH